MATKKQDAGTEVTIEQLRSERITFHLVGTSPMILNRMSQKTLHELLLPKGRKNAAEKASTLKHEPLQEFRASPYTSVDDRDPTLLLMPSTAFKSALRSAAVDMPGASKAQMGRLTFVEGQYVGVYGVPKLFMCVTRSADMARTPDVRTRAILPRWAATLSIRFVVPILRDKAVANLLAAAGVTQGIGDWRPEKGKGDFGQFRLAAPDDAEYLEIVKAGGRIEQKAAMLRAEPHDAESADLLEWFVDESKLRGFKVAA